MGNTHSLSNNTQGTSFILVFKEWLEQKVSEPETELEPEQINLIRKLLTYASWADARTYIDIVFFDYHENRYSSSIESSFDIYVDNKFWQENDDAEIEYKVKQLIREWFQEYQPLIEQEYLKQKHSELITKLTLIKSKLTHWTNLVSKN